MAFFLEMDFIDKNIENYSLDFTENESDLLKSLNRETNANVLNLECYRDIFKEDFCLF